jgi:Uncharacterized protein conserved in bacteria (DUF2219)
VYGRSFRIFVTAWLSSAAFASDATSAPANTNATQCAPQSSTGVSLFADEHLIVSPYGDRDYTGGGQLVFSGEKAARHWFTPDAPLGAIDHLLFSPDKSDSELCAPSYAIGGGLLEFTPQDIQLASVLPFDRPYASLFYLSNGRRYVRADDTVAFNTSLTIGALGLQAADTVQRALHSLTNSHKPLGWSHQISAGGEPTARYTLSRQERLTEGSLGDWTQYDFKWTLGASAGTVTEGSLALAGRWGRISSPWWSATPEQTTYAEDTHPAPPPLTADANSELYVLFGGRVKARGYNAFLEGQFRHSDLRLNYDDLNQFLAEAWTGAQWRSTHGWEIRFLSHWQTPEIRRSYSSYGSRKILWGSVEFGRSW